MRSHHRLMRLADRQHGVVTRRQLRVLAYSDAAITRAAGVGRLHRVHRGVYSVGRSELTSHGRCLAAVAACRPDALLSHASAAWLWGLLPSCPAIPEVTVPRRGHARRDVRVHHSPALAEEDRSEYERIPATTVARTLLDLAATGRRRRLDNAIQRAERLDRLDLGQIDALLDRPGAQGRKALREAIETYRDDGFFRGRSERLFLALVKKAGLPRPAINHFVAGHEVDAYWEAERFAVEVDGWESHRSRASFESDPLRIEDLKLAGIEAIRITARRIEREPEKVAERLGILLARRRTQLSAGWSAVLGDTLGAQ
ncbi:MAG TPA: type IV toxin-antitoxin system AbiEi family antitoxin domain-containing protein [Solirubrobacterales bacterium]|nr:type IV toxin-antitoxin system AbiEi family antitoxin domain-containing protein [Solirubrobacterales bacterium]